MALPSFLLSHVPSGSTSLLTEQLLLTVPSDRGHWLPNALSPSPEYLLFTFTPEDCLCWVENPKIILFAQHLIDTASFLLASLVSHKKCAVVGTISLVKVTHHGSLRLVENCSLSLVFLSFIMVNLGMGFFGFILCRTCPVPLVRRFYLLPNLGIFSHFFLQLFFFSALPSSSPPSGTRTTQISALSISFCRFLRLFAFLEVSLPLFSQIGNIQRSIFKCPPPPIISIMLMSRSQGVFYVNDCPFYFQSCHWVLYIFYFFADLFYLSIHTPKAEGEDLRQDRLGRASNLVLEVAAQPSRQQGSPLVWSGWSGSLGKW